MRKKCFAGTLTRVGEIACGHRASEINLFKIIASDKLIQLAFVEGDDGSGEEAGG